MELGFPLGSAGLTGRVLEDGLLTPPGAVTATWSLPYRDTVPSGDIRALAPTVTASQPGPYHLKLAASDSSGVAALKVIGMAVTVGLDGTWQQDVSPAGATTPIAVKATDAAGNVTNNSITITQ